MRFYALWFQKQGRSTGSESKRVESGMEIPTKPGDTLLMNNTTPVVHKTFIRLMGPKVKASYLKEAKRVGYQITKDLFTFTVRDNEALVFKGVQARKGIWAVTFSKDYWQEEKDQLPVGVSK